MSQSILCADFTDAEKKLVEAAKRGKSADYRTGNKALDNPAKGADWGPERSIRAEIIYALAVGDVPGVHAKGVQIEGAKIIGTLDFEGAKIPRPLRLIRCFIGEQISLIGTDVPSIDLTESQVAEIEADGIRTRGDVCLKGGTPRAKCGFRARRLPANSTARAAFLKTPEASL